MAKKAGLIGMETVTHGLNAKLKQYQSLSVNGIRRSIILIREDMEKVPPMVPKDTGTLAASWDQTIGTNAKGDPGAIFGFTANYAVYVHEMVGEEINWNRKGSGAKFFQAAIRRNFKTIIKLVGVSMKTGK